jgi:hypothetical protein
MDFKRTVYGLAVCIVLGFAVSTLHAVEVADQFDQDTISSGAWQTVGRGHYSVNGGVLRVQDGYVTTGDAEWKHYSLKFRARAVKETPQVQIWAGFRHYNRDYRYVVALRGGSNNHLYLARYGAEGYDKFLGLEPLDFSPMPSQWYVLEVVVAGNKIAVYFNDEKTPRLVAEDKDAPFDKGQISLGGSYLPTEFDWIKVKPVAENILDGVEIHRPDAVQVAERKHLKRQQQRQNYRPYYVPSLKEERTVLSLNGEWLFMPDQQVADNPADISHDDNNWHVMDVPNFWVPLQCWLEGETFGSFNKGQNDKYHMLEEARCDGYTFDWEKTRSAWYRHYIDLPDTVTDKKVVIDFEGVALISAVYMNGHKLLEHPGMFGPFQVDVTDFVHPGRNVMALHVWRKWDKTTSESVSLNKIDSNYADAWNVIETMEKGKTGEVKKDTATPEEIKEIPHGFFGGDPGGIWKPVNLVISNKVKVEKFYFVPTLKSADIEVLYSNNTQKPQPIELSYQIKNCLSGEILCAAIVKKVNMKPGSTQRTKFSTPTVKPKLWAPGQPNLYWLTFSLKQGDHLIDSSSEKVGFRTFEVKGDKLYFNGHPMWIRGANHMPAHIMPNDGALANKFMQVALEHNVFATRSHCSPFSETWLDAADEAGVMVSYEGTWPWLMLQGEPPVDESIQIWRNELAELIKANRNHPSIFLWTMNNEMKFYLLEDGERLGRKGRILSDAIKMIRKLDDTRPVVADSAYFRKHAIDTGKYERIILPNKLDDGDIDDAHAYYNWYQDSFFHLFKGKFGNNFSTPGRPLISQELSTGYPRSDDGLPTRFYLYQHQTPQTLVGKDAYEQADPKYFQTRHAMMTKELVEVFRRIEHEKVSGIMPFAFETWFYHAFDSERILPMLTAQSLKTAYQPVFASVELFGRHYYADDTIDANITLINDSENLQALPQTQAVCEIMYQNQPLASHKMVFKPLAYYATSTQKLSVKLPAVLPEPRIDACLVVKVKANGKLISRNEYDLVLAQKDWAVKPDVSLKRPYYILENDKEAENLLAFYDLKASKISAISELSDDWGVLVLASLKNKPADYAKIMDFVSAGGQAILLNNGKAVVDLLPEIVLDYKDYRHEIVTMNIKESNVFDELQPLDMAWFSDGTDVPYAATGRYSLDRLHPKVKVLAETLEHHGYLKTPLDYQKIGGSPLFAVDLGRGRIIVSQIRYDAIEHDPIAARLILNILKNDCGRDY